MLANSSKNYNLSDDLLAKVPDEDKVLIENILQGLESLGSDEFPACRKYKVTIIATGYLIHAKLPASDPFEVNIEDLLFLQSIHPARIENIAIGRASHGTHNVELFIRVLDFRQRIMIKSSIALYRQKPQQMQEAREEDANNTAILLRKRKMQEIAAPEKH